MDSDSGGKDSKKSSRGRGRGRGSRTRGRGRKKTGVSRSGDEQELNREVGVQNENEPLSSENDSRVSPKSEYTSLFLKYFDLPIQEGKLSGLYFK